MSDNTDFQPLVQAVTSGKHKVAKEITTSLLTDGVNPEAILDAMVGGMDEIGERFSRNEVFVPEMLIAARAMKEALTVLEPELVKSGHKPVATAVIGTVQGDLHDIGKNLVSMMWKGANFNVIDLGSNVSPDKFVAAAKEHDADVIGLSALLTTTMPAMRAAVETIKGAGLDNVKVVVGGAPISEEFCNDIGADGYSADASSAVGLVRDLLAVA